MKKSGYVRKALFKSWKLLKRAAREKLPTEASIGIVVEKQWNIIGNE
jgi:hypothetical protein